MITDFKIYEKNKKSSILPSIGDYVICESIDFTELNSFTLSNIGQIIEIIDIKYRWDRFIVQFDYIPDYLESYQIYHSEIDYSKKYKNAMSFSLEELIHISDDKSKLEFLTQTNKFNI